MNNLPMGPTELLNTFKGFFQSGQSNLLHPALGLLGTLSMISLVIAALWWAYDEDGSALKELLRKIMFFCAFIYIVKSWSWLVKCVIDGFVWVGCKAGGGGDISVIDNPSEIIWNGFQAVNNLVKAIAAANPVFLTSYLINVIIFFIIIICFALIAIQVFLVQVEFGIIATLGLMLIPFGVWKPTAFIAEKVFGAIVSFGVKLMVLAFILTITFPVLKQLAIPAEPSLAANINVLVCSAMLAFLSLHAPGVASGLIFGSPSLGYQQARSGMSATKSNIMKAASVAAPVASKISTGVAKTLAAARGGKSA
ncbi:MAG: P-type conjugative transfer protein TrbL [Desulfuromonadales bacterium]|nr:P-type conjugative transfer protein TrbL [Desulfuromonadales bacterium]